MEQKIIDWEFNHDVADRFSCYVRKHIPDYDKVLNLSVNLCNEKLKASDPILEIGCAVGETINLLHQKGFTNIHAVDNSPFMLEKCNKNIAQYYYSNVFPKIKIKFKSIICNWTLHFIKNKKKYLKQIYNNLSSNSFLILTEKTCNTGLALEQYHNFKRSQGVSEEEIKQKAESLRQIMFINNIEWYIKTLKKNKFKQVYVANSTWCFTTFIAIK